MTPRRLMEVDPARPGFVATLRGDAGLGPMIVARVQTVILATLLLSGLAAVLR